MKTMPALSIKQGRIVVADKDEYMPVGEPVEVLRGLEKKGHEEFYIIDIEGLEKNKIQIETVSRLAEEFTLWIDGGFRNEGVVEDALILGVEIAVMGTKSIKSMEEIRKAVEMSESIAVCVDYFSGVLKWGNVPEDMGEIARILADYSVKKVIFSNLSEKAPWKEALKTFRDFELWFGGNLPENLDFEGIEGIIVPYSRFIQS